MRALVVFVMLVGGGGVARADVISPEVAACNNKLAGDACEGGVCAPAKCSHVLPPGPDGTPQPSEYDCMKCVAGTPTTPATASTPGSSSRTPLVVGLGLGALALAGGVWFARKRGKQAA